jgi:hypothetical protein
MLDLGGEPGAPVGEPVELVGQLADDPAGGLLGRDGDGLGGERGLDPGEPEPLSRAGGDRPSRVLPGLLVAVALVGLVVCLATDVIA